MIKQCVLRLSAASLIQWQQHIFHHGKSGTINRHIFIKINTGPQLQHCDQQRYYEFISMNIQNNVHNKKNCINTA